MDNQVILSEDSRQSEKSVIIYRSEDGTIQLEVQLHEETVWLTQAQMAILFETTRNNITIHIGNLFKEGELEKISVCKESLLTASDGKPYKTKIYNLDVIISVGYRVKSQRGIDYRHWANETLKQHLFRNYTTNQRIFYLEQKVAEHDKKIDFFVKTSLPPVEGVFYNGQIFDAYNFISDLVRKAKNEIILIDNYVDDSVLKILNKRENNVAATIYTAHISENLKLDLEKHNSQYQPINIKQFNKSHDRFMIIDNDVYHIGASLKDLGKRMFAFSKMEIGKEIILSLL